jgi:DNA helicase II / ATP-dependent DNA helicase PcrA
VQYLDELNAEQRKAVEAGDGPLLIIAGPGTGKTRTLTTRILYLIESGKARSQDILALTFTKKAAGEMADRVGNRAVTICTFHALCHQLLGGEMQFASEPERLTVIKSLTKPASLKRMSTRELALLISRAKNMAEERLDVQRLAAAYTAALHDQGLTDFDDLLLQARDSLQAGATQKQTYTYILVDEFQDTNRLQYDILRLLQTNDNLFVIGDPNQSIYAFRGASGTIFEQFKTDFPQALEIDLTTNYRSASPIVSLANSIFADAPKLTAHSTAKGEIRAIELLNEYSEATWVVSEIQQALGGADMLQASAGEAKRGLRDFAVLYRSRKAGMIVQKYLADSGLPFQVVGEDSPYERPDVQQVIAMLRTTHNLKPDSIHPADIATALVQQAGLESREVHQFISTLVRFKTLADALAHLDAIADQQFYDPDAEAITLLTIHAAKGLEFPCVFLVGAEEGVLPHGKADEQEEKRLFYVAITRAKEQLDILHTTKRGGEPATVSHFITDVPDAILPKSKDPNLQGDRRRAQKRHAKRAQTSLF